MQASEARTLLGFSPYSRPSFSQISEAYSSLQSGVGHGSPSEAAYVRVVRYGVPGSYRTSNSSLVKVPFFLLMFATVSFGGLNAARAYQREQDASRSRNPFLP